MRSSRVLVIDCGAAHLACGVFELRANERPRLVQFASEPFESAPDDEALWSAAITQALLTIQQRDKLIARECLLAVPGHLALTKFVRTPSVARDKRDRIVQFEAAQNIPHPLDEVAWGYAEVSDDGVDLELMLAAVKLDAMETLCAAVEKAGFAVMGAEPASLALGRACQQMARNAGGAPLIIDVGARSTHLIFAGGEGLFTRTLPLGGNVISQALAEDLQLDFRAAEALKVQVLSSRSSAAVDEVTRTAVSRASEGFMSRLQLEVTRSRLGYSRQPGAEMPQRVWLTGEGSRIAGLPTKLHASLDLPVESLDFLPQIDLTDRSRLDGAEKVAGHLAVLTGLALSDSTTDTPRLELLPASRRSAQQQRRAQPWWLVAAALVVAALLPPLGYYQIRTARLQSQVATQERQLAPLRRLQAGNADNLDRLHQLEEQVKAISGAAEARTNWVAFFADLQQRLGEVGDVWLEGMRVLPTPAANPDENVVKPVRRLVLAGRLLDTNNPLSTASDESNEKVNRLIGDLGKSPFVQTVSIERFDNQQPGILRFDLTLMLNPDKPL